jgi:hypothetical protein
MRGFYAPFSRMRESDVRAFVPIVFVITAVLANPRILPAAAESSVIASGTNGRDSQTEQPAKNSEGGDMPGMKMPSAGTSRSEPDWMPSPESGSGTEWQPASTSTPMWMKSLGAWGVMAHGVVFVDYNQQGGPRGEGKAESVNWLMLMEEHKLGSGNFLFREMFSAESLTSPHPGFPELFQTGETYHGQPLVDHQHPHNVFAELSFDYTHPIGVLFKEKVSWEFYGAAAGEPALGPVAFMHRASASELPMAPLSHHLQDSTHTSFGVINTGLMVNRIKVEGSIFNGREPDEKRYTIQFAPLDSWSTRLSVAASKNWTAEYSYGRLEHPEAFEPGSQRRQTAAVEYVKAFRKGSWATSAVWGRVHNEFDNHNLNGYLLETTANFKMRNYAFSRLELVDKDELFPDNPALPAFRIGAYSFGGAHDLIQSHLWRLSVGADFTLYSKPSVLDSRYGKDPVSFQIFLRVRPAFSHGGH